MQQRIPRAWRPASSTAQKERVDLVGTPLLGKGMPKQAGPLKTAPHLATKATRQNHEDGTAAPGGGYAAGEPRGDTRASDGDSFVERRGNSLHLPRPPLEPRARTRSVVAGARCPPPAGRRAVDDTETECAWAMHSSYLRAQTRAHDDKRGHSRARVVHCAPGAVSDSSHLALDSILRQRTGHAMLPGHAGQVPVRTWPELLGPPEMQLAAIRARLGGYRQDLAGRRTQNLLGHRPSLILAHHALNFIDGLNASWLRTRRRPKHAVLPGRAARATVRKRPVETAPPDGLSGRRCGSRFNEESSGLLPRGETHVVCPVIAIEAPLALAPGCKNPNGLSRQHRAAKKA